MRIPEPDNAGTILLLLASRDAQSVAQLATASQRSAAGTLRQLHRLTEQGFIIASRPNAAGLSVYRLNPKGVRTESGEPQPRMLVVDGTVALRNLMTIILESDGYAVIAARLQVAAVTLLEEVAFDLVIVDSVNQEPSEAVANTSSVLGAAGATPVALFSALRIHVAAAQAAGLHVLLSQPFNLDVLKEHVRTLLDS
jgi:CheY-like chemotaxis protein